VCVTGFSFIYATPYSYRTLVRDPLKSTQEIAAIDHGSDHVRVSCERAKIVVLEGQIKRNKKNLNVFNKN